MKPPCKLHRGSVLYYDTYSYSRYPGANESDTQKQTLETGPSSRTIRVPLFAARTHNATGQSRVTLSLQ